MELSDDKKAEIIEETVGILSTQRKLIENNFHIDISSGEVDVRQIVKAQDTLMQSASYPAVLCINQFEFFDGEDILELPLQRLETTLRDAIAHYRHYEGTQNEEANNGG